MTSTVDSHRMPQISLVALSSNLKSSVIGRDWLLHRLSGSRDSPFTAVRLGTSWLEYTGIHAEPQQHTKKCSMLRMHQVQCVMRSRIRLLLGSPEMSISNNLSWIKSVISRSHIKLMQWSFYPVWNAGDYQLWFWQPWQPWFLLFTYWDDWGSISGYTQRISMMKPIMVWESHVNKAKPAGGLHAHDHHDHHDHHNHHDHHDHSPSVVRYCHARWQGFSYLRQMQGLETCRCHSLLSKPAGKPIWLHSNLDCTQQSETKIKQEKKRHEATLCCILLHIVASARSYCPKHRIHLHHTEIDWGSGLLWVIRILKVRAKMAKCTKLQSIAGFWSVDFGKFVDKQW